MSKIILLFLLLPCTLFSQQLPSIEEKTKGLQRQAGFLDFFYDENAGKIFLEIKELDKGMLYQVSLPAGLGSNDVGLDRGLMGNTAIIKFTRVGNKILLLQPNYDYRAVTNDAAEKSAVEQSFAQSVLWGFTAEAAGNKSVLVDATAFLMRDVMQVSSQLSNNRQGNYSIDLSRSALYMPRTKNFPLNSELESTITFTSRDARPGNYVRTVTPSPDAITLRMHHSFVQLPDEAYKPRAFDARSGLIPISYFDYSTAVTEPINKQVIIRHRLAKKDPAAAKSEAVKPIVYYLDNGTPEPIRSALLEGARWWNQAFEAAGFINAFQVKLLPEGADPMDIRYNMINWVHRSTRGWSYGAAVVDPRTGEIIKGNVTLGSLRVRQDYLIAQGLLSPFTNDQFGENGIPTGDNKMLAMALQRLKQLAAHEVGHTIGLMHNYIASTQGRASVMDYPSPVVELGSDGKLSLANAYTNEIGDWDKVAIAYAYTDMGNTMNEQPALNAIITGAAKKGLTFISDRDARDPAGLHPMAHLWDQDAEPVAGLRNVMKVREKALARFGENSIVKGTPMALLEDVLVPVYLYHRYQVEAVSKIVAGADYAYALKGMGQPNVKIISREQQLLAMRAIADCIDPAFLALPQKITSLIPPRPAGYEYTKELFPRRTGLSFDPLAAAETAAELPLSLLFNPARINRLVQNEAANAGPGLPELLDALQPKSATLASAKSLQGLIQLQNEQLILGHLLQLSVTEELSFAARAAVLEAIDKIKIKAKRETNGTDAARKGHGLLTLDRIENRLSAKPFEQIPIPPGSPIGCDWQ